jgi:hypothetical protein
MFETILRRWRIATPLVTLATIITVVGGMALTAGASASTIESASFRGRAIGEVQTNVFPHDVNCDTGSLKKHGGSQELEADTGFISHLDVDDNTNDFQADQCNAEVVSHLGKHSASVTSSVTIQDVSVGSDPTPAGEETGGDLNAETITATVKATCSGSKTHKSWSSFFSDETKGDGFVEIGEVEYQVTGDANQTITVIDKTPGDNETIFVTLNELSTSKRAISLTAAHVVETVTSSGEVTDEFFVGNVLAGVHCDA